MYSFFYDCRNMQLYVRVSIRGPPLSSSLKINQNGEWVNEGYKIYYCG